MHPETEANLSSKYKQLQKHRFKSKGLLVHDPSYKQLLADMESETQQFKVSDDWFDAFKVHHKISFR